MVIDGELFDNECAITLLKPIQSRTEEKKFNEYINKFKPIYYVYVGGNEVIISYRC